MFSDTEIATGVFDRTVAGGADCVVRHLGCHAASTDAMTRTGSKAETALAEPYQPTRQERAALATLLARKIREAGVLSRDVVVGQDYPATERGSDVVEEVFAEEPAPLAWLGKLICLMTALMTATSVWALVG
jgi:hypothetical protein